MTDTHFINYDTSTPIVADWLNDVNGTVYQVLGTGGAAPTSTTDVVTKLGVETVVTNRATFGATGGAALVGFAPTGTIAATTVQAAIAEVSGDLAASGGSALLGFLPAGIHAVAATAQGKMRERVSAVDFGCDTTATTEATTTLQYAVDYARSVGGNLWLNHGRYLMNGVVTVDYSTLAGPPGLEPYQINITGEGAGNTVLISPVNEAYALEVIGNATFSHENTVIKDFSISNPPGGINTVNGLYMFDVAFTKLENLGFFGLNVGITLTSVLSAAFENLFFYYCHGGVNLVPGGFSLANALNWDNCRWANCDVTAVAGGPATQISFNSCNIEGCGTQGNARTGGINLTFSGIQGEVGASFEGCYFEANAGGWDVNLTNTGAFHLVHTFKNCNFQRVGDTIWVTNNVRASNTGSGTQQLVFIGCTFTGYDGEVGHPYVPNAGHLYVNLGAGCTAVCVGCHFEDAIEQGTLVNLEDVATGGTVASVAATVPTGFTVTGSPITTSGTLAITYSGQIPVASLGTGTPSTETLLVGNGTWSNNLPSEFAFNGTGIGQYSGVHGISTTAAVIGMNNSTAVLLLDGTNLHGAIDNNIDLGSLSYRYKDAYLAGYVNANGTGIGQFSGVHGVSTTASTIGLNNSAAVLFLDGTTLRGAVDNDISLGSASYQFKNLYLKGSAYWNGYTITAPAGSTTTYLRNDGSWATPTSAATNYSYVGTLTGFATTPTGTIYYTRVGDVVTMDIFSVSDTSNATTMTITGGTAAMRPASVKTLLVGVSDNSITTIGIVNIETSGTLTFFREITGTGFTASGIKGVERLSFSYTVV